MRSHKVLIPMKLSKQLHIYSGRLFIMAIEDGEIA